MLAHPKLNLPTIPIAGLFILVQIGLVDGACGMFQQTGTAPPAADNSTGGVDLSAESTGTNEAQESDSTQLTNTANQEWKTYDISGYTSAVKSVPDPEKNVLNWILRETGTEAWLGDPAGQLSVGRQKVRAYHTPAVQLKVAGIIERFVATRDRDEVIGLQVLTLNNPNWRAKSLRLLTPITGQVNEMRGDKIDAWTTTKENAAQLFHEFSKRADFRPLIQLNLVTESGQPKTVAKVRPIPFLRSIRFQPRQFPPFQVETGQTTEGYDLELSTLRSIDGKTMDAEISFRVRQVEQLRTVNMEVPAPEGGIRKQPIQVPQKSGYQMKNRFQWPVNRVLVIGLGVIPAPNFGRGLNAPLGGILEGTGKRADVILMIDCKGIYKRGEAPRSAFRLVPVPQSR